MGTIIVTHPDVGVEIWDIDGRRYRATVTFDEVEVHGQHVHYRTIPPTARVVDVCEHCGRGDWTEVVAHSIEQVIELGWLVEV